MTTIQVKREDFAAGEGLRRVVPTGNEAVGVA
jgi:hypothetical protein